MITLEEFKSLSLENKRNFLKDLLIELVPEDGSKNESLETLVFDSTEEELIRFYEATTDDKKKEEYFSLLRKNMEEANKGIINTYNEMIKEKNTADEYIEQQKEGNVDNILEKIN